MPDKKLQTQHSATETTQAAQATTASPTTPSNKSENQSSGNKQNVCETPNQQSNSAIQKMVKLFIKWKMDHFAEP